MDIINNYTEYNEYINEDMRNPRIIKDVEFKDVKSFIGLDKIADQFFGVKDLLFLTYQNDSDCNKLGLEKCIYVPVNYQYKIEEFKNAPVVKKWEFKYGEVIYRMYKDKFPILDVTFKSKHFMIVRSSDTQKLRVGRKDFTQITGTYVYSVSNKSGHLDSGNSDMNGYFINYDNAAKFALDELNKKGGVIKIEILYFKNKTAVNRNKPSKTQIVTFISGNQIHKFNQLVKNTHDRYVEYHS